MTHTCQSYGRRQITVPQVFVEAKGRLQTREGETHIEHKRRHRLQCGLDTKRESRGAKIHLTNSGLNYKHIRQRARCHPHLFGAGFPLIPLSRGPGGRKARQRSSRSKESDTIAGQVPMTHLHVVPAGHLRTLLRPKISANGGDNPHKNPSRQLTFIRGST